MLSIPANEQRKELTKIIHESMHYPEGRGKNIWRFDPNVSGVKKVLTAFPEIRLLEVFPGDNPYVRCQWYAFRQEQWYNELAQMDEFSIEQALLDNGFHILKNVVKCYTEVDCPEEDAIVLYQFAAKPERVEHFGIYSNERVRSKWSNSHAYEHPIELVPPRYGDTARFMKKKAPLAL